MTWSAIRAGSRLLVPVLAIHCGAPTLSQTPPPLDSDTESMVLLWQYGGEKYGVAYDPRVSGPRGFALPNFDGETASVIALAYDRPVEVLNFSQLTVNLDEEQGCLPIGPSSIWSSQVDEKSAQPWSEGSWDKDQVRDAFGLADCPAADTCIAFPPASRIELSQGALIEILEPYREGFLIGDQEGNFTYVDANKVAAPAVEFQGLPSLAAATDAQGALWLAGFDGRVVRIREGSVEDVSIETTNFVTGLSLSKNNDRALAISLAQGDDAPFVVSLHLLKNGRWQKLTELTGIHVRFSVAWDSADTAYFTFGGKKLCRLIDEAVSCNEDFRTPGPMAFDETLGVVLAAKDNRLLRSVDSSWTPVGGVPFVRRPTSVLSIPGGILAGNDVGKIQQIRSDGGRDCPIISTIERDTDFLVQNGSKIASIGALNVDNNPVLVILDVPADR